MGQCAVIHNQKKALAVLIQASYGKEVFSVDIGKEIQDGFLFSILSGGKHSHRLIHHVIGELFIMNRLVFIYNFGISGLNLNAWILHNLTVNADQALSNFPF